MALSREQYEKIKRILDDRRSFALREQQRKQEEAEEAIPELPVIRQEFHRLNRRELKARFLKDPAESRRQIAECARERKELLKTKKDLLKEYGYRPGDLEPAWTCRKCQDTGYIDDQKCTCFRVLEAQLINEEAGLPDFLPETGLEQVSVSIYDDSAPMPDLPGKKLTQRAYMEKNVIPWLRQYLDGFDRPGSHNLFLYGEPGTGKTYLSGCLAKSLIDRQKTVLYVSAGDLFDLYRRQAVDDGADPSLQGKLDKITDCDLLILDDLGTESPSQYTVSRLFSLISHRLSAGLSTIISSNLNLDQIGYIYDSRIASRIGGNYTAMKFFGTDLRLKKARTKGDRT